jgi:ubiquinone/menaquinone biosynthesis C-methylase UbiE
MSEELLRHYAHPDLESAILTALRAAGKDIDRLQAEDLAPIDEFHIRGRQATLELARAAGMAAGMRVLDVGSGIGGPSRCLARDFGCEVTGIDLSEDYCRAATLLARRVGLAEQVTYRQGDALDLPFADESFDAVWSQHVAMNIADKAALYGQMRRVLKPGATLAIYDVVAGAAGPVHFPVVWAGTAVNSFLVAPSELHWLIATAGFEVVHWQDDTATARAWFTGIADRIAERGLPPLGIHLLLGSDFALMAANQRRNLDEDRIGLIQAVARRR